MSIIQDKLAELRYIKRKNLHEEAKVIGNYYRDIIRSYGVDCRYYKLKTNYPTEFTDELSQNNLILHAYGCEPNPDFSISANMIAYMEVENDVFNLNKFGVIPDMNVNFYFDSTDFAAALATKMGRLREWDIQTEGFSASFTGAEAISGCLSNGGLSGIPFSSDILSGNLSINLMDFDGPVSADMANTVSCDPYLISDCKWIFPVNDKLYKSFQYFVYGNAEEKVVTRCTFGLFNEDGTPIDRSGLSSISQIIDSLSADETYVLRGQINGTVLFHDLNMISKYEQKIVPNVGDIITIDFPDETSREQYQITESVDKNLSPDGQNPLLHKYFWKCKARRYVNSQEDFPEKNYANMQLDEKFGIINEAAQNMADKVEAYPHTEDAFYGGYEKQTGISASFHDITEVIPEQAHQPPDAGEEPTHGTMTIVEFGNGARLTTDGYSLYYFIDSKTKENIEIIPYSGTKVFPISSTDHFRFLKATDDILVFVNIEGTVYEVSSRQPVSKKDLKLCLDALTTISAYIYGASNPNMPDDNYYKFSNCNTMLFVEGKSLLCKYGNEVQPKIIASPTND